MQNDKQELNEEPDSNPPEKESATDGRQPSLINSFKVAKSSNIQTSFTLFKSFIGTGVLALPYAYKTAGAGLAIIVTIFISFMLTHCFLLLLKTVDDKAGKGKMSLPTLTMEILGIKGRYLVQTLLFIEQLGCCVGILIFTKDFLNHVLCSFEIENLCDNTLFNLGFALSLVVPLSLINNMHYFYIPSLAANFFIIMGLMVQMYYNSQLVSEDPSIRSNVISGLGTFHFSNLHLFFGVALFSYEGVGVTLSIRDSMEQPQDLPKLLKNQMILLTAIYMIFAVTSCLVLGENLQDIVFFSLPTDDPLYLLVQILYAVSALCTYPIQFFPAIRIIENSVALRFILFTETGRNRNVVLRYTLRLSLIGLVFLVAYTAKSFHLFLNLLGSCVFTFCGFGLPIWLYLVHFKERVSKKGKLLNYSILAITSSFGVVGCASSLRELFS